MKFALVPAAKIACGRLKNKCTASILKQELGTAEPMRIICLMRGLSLIVKIPCTVLPAKSDSDVMFCLQSYQGLIIDRSLVY